MAVETRRRWHWPVALLIAGVALASWWATRTPDAVAVTVAVVESGTVEATVSNTRAGTVKACRRAKLAPTIGGTLETLAVREGESVKAGQVLLRLWSRDIAAELAVARGDHAAAEARAEQACVLAKQAGREAKRLTGLREDNLVSEDRLDQAKSAAEAQDAACRAGRAAVDVASQRIEAASAALARTVLRAPFDGVVAEVNGEVGEYITPSPLGIATLPAVDLLDLSCLYVSAPIDEVDAAALRTGLPARVTLDAYGKREFPARVRRIAPYVLDLEKQARTVEVEVGLREMPKDVHLLPGYTADVEIIREAREGVLRLPAGAVLEGDRVLLLASDGVLAERAFTAGLRNWDYVEVQDGLAAGERVVTSLSRAGVKAGTRARVEAEAGR